MKSIEYLDLDGLQVLDGGMATELEAMGCDLSGPLWSAHILDSAPEKIAAQSSGYLITMRAPCLTQQGDCVAVIAQQVSAKHVLNA